MFFAWDQRLLPSCTTRENNRRLNSSVKSLRIGTVCFPRFGSCPRRISSSNQKLIRFLLLRFLICVHFHLLSLYPSFRMLVCEIHGLFWQFIFSCCYCSCQRVWGRLEYFFFNLRAHNSGTRPWRTTKSFFRILFSLSETCKKASTIQISHRNWLCLAFINSFISGFWIFP